MLQFDIGDKTAVIVIDMQNDGVQPNGAIPAEGARSIIEHIKSLLNTARRNDLPVIYTQHVHRKDLSDFGIAHYFEPPSCLEGSEGAQIIEELRPEADDIVVTKTRYDAFIGTELDLILRQMNITNLIVAGILTDACVLGTVQHARGLDYKVCLLKDCTAGTTQAKHEAALNILSEYCARISPLKEAIALFGLER